MKIIEPHGIRGMNMTSRYWYITGFLKRRHASLMLCMGLLCGFITPVHGDQQDDLIYTYARQRVEERPAGSRRR